MIARTFGTWRGLARLALSYPQSLPGLSHARAPDPAAVRRLVFVCHGNICRSAVAEAVAHGLGLESASFGLSTTSGKPAHPEAAEAALALGHDLAAHRTTRVEDFAPRDGDVLLAMEHRHLARLAADERLRHLPRALLGRYLAPPLPHLHDPYRLDPAYMAVCLARVERAVRALAVRYPGAAVSPGSP